MVKAIESKIEKLNHFANRLNERNDLVYKESYQGSEKSVRMQKAEGYMVSGGVVCMCSLYSGNPLVIAFTCGIGGFVAVNGFLIYNSLAKILQESKQLRKDIQKRRKELANFRASLKALKRKNDLKL